MATADINFSVKVTQINDYPEASTCYICRTTFPYIHGKQLSNDYYMVNKPELETYIVVALPETEYQQYGIHQYLTV